MAGYVNTQLIRGGISLNRVYDKANMDNAPLEKVFVYHLNTDTIKFDECVCYHMVEDYGSIYANIWRNGEITGRKKDIISQYLISRYEREIKYYHNHATFWSTKRLPIGVVREEFFGYFQKEYEKALQMMTECTTIEQRLLSNYC